MSDNLFTNPWSPFDPEWYEEQFDKYLTTSEFHKRQQDILDKGFMIPDADGSKSSVFRNNAVLNNSFDIDAAAKTITDVYNNTSHVLKARGHDNTHFFKWNGFMQDMILTENTLTAEFTLYTNDIIPPKSRSKFKLSQYFRQWLSIEDIMNNGDIFGWNFLLFIDNRIYSEYMIRIDDHETIIQFNYFPFWITTNVPVSIYKFDTSYQSRNLISLELCENQWDWKMPMSYIDQTNFNSDRAMIAINKINDQDIRNDGNDAVDVLGDNIEFVKIVDGYMDLTTLSDYNKALIHSEKTEYLWMGVMVPKFLHEYPILLPVDFIYRPYIPDWKAVYAPNDTSYSKVKSYDVDSGVQQVYIDNRDGGDDMSGTWTSLIRPIVLTDAFEHIGEDPNAAILDRLVELKALVSKSADADESFRYTVSTGWATKDEIISELESLVEVFSEMRDMQNSILMSKKIDLDQEYESLYMNDFMTAVDDINDKGSSSSYLTNIKYETGNFWNITSPLIYKVSYMIEMFDSSIIMMEMSNTNIWEETDAYVGQVRFQRPIDASDFWVFEYDSVTKVWRPVSATVTHMYPDIYRVYVDGDMTSRRIFKAFFFYSDTMNVLEESSEFSKPPVEWNSSEYDFDQPDRAIYRDVFMEKFYWMGIETIYDGFISTGSRWELLEYIIDNPTYDRFNQLFMHTMDPYFKLGLSTYFQGDNLEFPIDELISKMMEASTLDWNGFSKVANFERYLDNAWQPSYFDNVININDRWYPSDDQIVYRPNNTFDLRRILPVIQYVNDDIQIAYNTIRSKLDEIINQLRIESYNMTVSNIEKLDIDTQAFIQYITVDILEFIENLDSDIFTLDDMNYLAGSISKYVTFVAEMKALMSVIYQETLVNEIYPDKQNTIQVIRIMILSRLREALYATFTVISGFDIETFMSIVNDLSTLADHNKDNDDDSSLMYQINKFENAWTSDVKESRTSLFVSTVKLVGMFEPNQSYTDEEVYEFIDLVVTIKSDLDALRLSIDAFLDNHDITMDETLEVRFDHAETIINKFTASLGDYQDARDNLVYICSLVRKELDLVDYEKIGITEKSYINNLNSLMDGMISAVSYIAAVPDVDAAEKNLEDFENCLDEWDAFLVIEKRIFILLNEIMCDDNVFITTLESKQSVMDAVKAYIELMNREYESDKYAVTYSQVFSTSDVRIEDIGFWYAVGDHVFVPNLGAYEVTEITGDIGYGKSIVDVGYRNTTFRDPNSQEQSYFTISSGVGMGMTIIPLEVTSEYIIDDSPVDYLVTRIKNVSRIIAQCAYNANPNNDETLNSAVSSIGDINSDWFSILKNSPDSMTSEIKTQMNELMDTLLMIITPSNELMSVRLTIDMTGIVSSYYSIMTSVYDFISSCGMLDESYYIYAAKARAYYISLTDFVGIMYDWSDPDIAAELVSELQYGIDIFRNDILAGKPSGDELSDIKTAMRALESDIESFSSVIYSLEYYTDQLIDVIDAINSKCDYMPDEYSASEWYVFTKIAPAIVGSGYVAGDIVEIVPELPTDTSGNKITVMQDIIESDKILLQITEVNNDRVMSLQPLMNYAIPYTIFGPRETVTKSGVGKGLWLDIQTSLITSADNTLLEHEDSYTADTDQYDDTDNFVFRFANIHDLNLDYEVFIGGVQDTTFFKRHEDIDIDDKSSISCDLIYVNANEVTRLKDSVIHIDGEHYFIYKIDGVYITESGSGYCEGQQLYIPTTGSPIKLTVGSVTNDPFKGIMSVRISDGDGTFTEDVMASDMTVIRDGMNNIDDEYRLTDYDSMTCDGITKPATLTYTVDECPFNSSRHDSLTTGDRNESYLYPNINDDNSGDYANVHSEDVYYCEGSRIDNMQHGIVDDKWNGIKVVNPPTDPFIPDEMRIPPVSNNREAKHEWLEVDAYHIHTVQFNGLEPDLIVETFDGLPHDTGDWTDGAIGKTVLVKSDINYGGHQMLYTVRTFIMSGAFVYNMPEYADEMWNTIEFNWMLDDVKHDYPSLMELYPDAPWETAKTYADVRDEIDAGLYQPTVVVDIDGSRSYIHDLTVDDLAVFNWTLKQWEDLSNPSRWKLEVFSVEDIVDQIISGNIVDDEKWGFKLTFLESESYSYEMRLYLCKNPNSQKRNAELIKEAKINVTTTISGEVTSDAITYSVNTSKDLIMRKMFPYEQYERFTMGPTVNGSSNYIIDFKLANYMHYKNEIHLEDVKLYNLTIGEYENILDESLFEVRFKDDRATSRGFENQSIIKNSYISSAGSGFVDGCVWGYNSDYGIHIFGDITANIDDDGYIMTFSPTHCPNIPDTSISLEFRMFQSRTQTSSQVAIIVIEFENSDVEVFGDGYIHNVTSRLAPIPDEIRIIALYNLSEECEYEVRINKTYQSWSFVETSWIITPTFRLDGVNIPSDRFYIMTDKGRFPMVNPESGLPSLRVTEGTNHTDVQFLNLYRMYETIQIVALPYPIRSVYTQRTVSSDGYINLAGMLNKPLNKKYFEFWMNGKLLGKEVTIITPTKIIMHGLTSLKNFEIIEVNRDSNEYFSDAFLKYGTLDSGREYHYWDYTTYLDLALEGKLDGDNYTLEEQAALLTPVWPQVEPDHPSFKDYPPNVDTDDDILMRVSIPGDLPIEGLAEASYQYMLVNTPSIEGVELTGGISWEQTGFIPITDERLTEIINEVWEDEIANDPYFEESIVTSDDEWFGKVTRLYDANGLRVHNLNDAVYNVTDFAWLQINSSTKTSKIIPSSKQYDLD